MKSLLVFSSCLLFNAFVCEGMIRIFRPFNRQQSNEGLAGPAIGNAACGNGAGSQWIRASPPSKWLSEYGTDYLLVYPGMKLTFIYDTPVSGTSIHQLQYCSPPSNYVGSEQIDDACFKPMQRHPEEDQTPYLEEYPDIDFFLDPSCTLNYALDEPEYRSSWIVPRSLRTQWPVLFRWVVQLSYTSCPHPAVCPPTIPDKIKNWVYKDADLGMECPIGIGTTAAAIDGCPNEEPCKANQSQVKLCLDAYAIDIASQGEWPADADGNSNGSAANLNTEAVRVATPCPTSARVRTHEVEVQVGKPQVAETQVGESDVSETRGYDRALVCELASLEMRAALVNAPHAVNFDNLQRYLTLAYSPESEDYAYLSKEAYWLLYLLNSDFCENAVNSDEHACGKWCTETVESSGSTLAQMVQYCAAVGVSQASDCLSVYGAILVCSAR
ncbi:hypothetical protein GNI_141260 [Gregarina niphandrodes]|uniref:Transmembrane protein n=1 Tax=Gregarina niphandrodes TaxID=110365 RepID=A0A023B062_GRENI|nr:hypothetical protein GNI_141260 [Gregarina niphandrodes]EZG45055.1 hypothetical protein GNI_141260 [Gregarina niphandrodes]|eukprot:XP_011132586.1 hypothetical protein GNI_141260 [Gregarina niphandrodes]